MRHRIAPAVLVASVAAAVLALGTASAALASPTGGEPQPSSSSYGDHHHHKPPPMHCEYVLLTGSAPDKDAKQHEGEGNPQPYATPTSTATAWGQQGDNQKGKHEQQETVYVEQVAKVCEGGKDGETLTVVDVTPPFVQESEGYAPTPSGYPSTIQRFAGLNAGA